MAIHKEKHENARTWPKLRNIQAKIGRENPFGRGNHLGVETLSHCKRFGRENGLGVESHHLRPAKSVWARKKNPVGAKKHLGT